MAIWWHFCRFDSWLWESFLFFLQLLAQIDHVHYGWKYFVRKYFEIVIADKNLRLRTWKFSYILYSGQCSDIFVQLTNKKIWNIKDSPGPSHFVCETNIGKGRIRHTTTLKLNDEFRDEFKNDWKRRHSESFYVGFVPVRHWFQTLNGSGLVNP